MINQGFDYPFMADDEKLLSGPLPYGSADDRQNTLQDLSSALSAWRPKIPTCPDLCLQFFSLLLSEFGKGFSFPPSPGLFPESRIPLYGHLVKLLLQESHSFPNPAQIAGDDMMHFVLFEEMGPFLDLKDSGWRERGIFPALDSSLFVPQSFAMPQQGQDGGEGA